MLASHWDWWWPQATVLLRLLLLWWWWSMRTSRHQCSPSSRLRLRAGSSQLNRNPSHRETLRRALQPPLTSSLENLTLGDNTTWLLNQSQPVWHPLKMVTMC
ncbi:hypothetical protein E2C01_090624 [Portunus trituberculatus]|uniref:Uncharacterized protein n=1 Tax=Portunus trituberculatus TaxID=210409 RepID=A0A5B7JSX0_PORTR|nr:hypothetical protein [Portunus trituberculatus]